MNERIQELISAYLHRGSTPEQERELFEACSRNPETAELLRQHLVLSLKLRGLRDEVQVPSDLRNDVLLRINALEADGIRNEEAQSAAATGTSSRRRFGFAHLFGTGLATAACAVAIVLLSGDPDPESAGLLQPVAQAQDTVYIVKKDTVTQLREVDRPVYIVRNAPAAPVLQEPSATDQGELASEALAAPESRAEAERTTRPEPPAPVTPASVPTRAGDSPTLAEVQPREVATREAKTENFIEQYNSMLVSVETVRLSSKDRIH